MSGLDKTAHFLCVAGGASAAQVTGMPSRKALPRAVPAALVVAAWLSFAPAAMATVPQASVLILLPGQPGLPAATAIASGVRAELLAALSFGVSIEMEHVDIARFASVTGEERPLRALYASKYGGHRFDVIVTALPEPFQFVLRSRDDLWPGTPVVVCGLDEQSARDLKPPPGFEVRTIRFDMEGTVRAAKQLLPDTRHVALVGGASPAEKVYHDLIRQAVAAVGELDLIDLTDLQVADALARVARLPEHTVVIQSSYQVDGAKRRFFGIDLVPLVSDAANRPVFTPLGLALGRGVVGGSIVEFEDIGRDAGIAALRLLRGARAASRPVPSSAFALPRFDGRQLVRWGLDEGRLPAGSRVIFHQPTLWGEYRWHVTGAIALLGVQTALILTLLVQRRRRRAAQAVTGGLLAALPGETALIDAGGTIVQVNEAWAIAARNGAGAESKLDVGANYLDACRNGTALPPEVATDMSSSVAAILRGERDEVATQYATTRHGESRWLELRVRRVPGKGNGATLTFLDVTAQRQAEAVTQRHLSQIAHLDRVAGMAQLASSIAHELNQPLTAIMINAQAAKRMLATSPPNWSELRSCLEDIVIDDRRAAEVVQRTRQMIKKTDFVRSALVLNDLVRTSIALVWNEALLRRVAINFTAGPKLPVIQGDLVQIQQVILNLLTNAISAAAESVDGVAARTVAVWTAHAGPYVELGVHDSGRGIEQADLERLFDPFFTTKEDGLGMGLAISRAIVEAHDGRLLVENDPRGGATFRLHLRVNQLAATMSS